MGSAQEVIYTAEPVYAIDRSAEDHHSAVKQHGLYDRVGIPSTGSNATCAGRRSLTD